MTDVLDDTTNPSADEVEGAELLTLDPKTLVIGANVRLDPRLDADFIASIRDRGVRSPIVAYRQDGQIVVDKGQRRTLAAVQTGRPTVLVVVYPDPPDARDRIFDQLDENHRRTGLLPAEDVAAFQQLDLLGVPAGTIATRTRRPADQVKAALRVAASPVASKAIAEHEALTIEQGAALAEFEDDPDVLRGLIAHATRGHSLDHAVARARADREEAAEKAALAAKLAADGVTVLDESPTYNDKKIQPLRYLKKTEESKKAFDGRTHRKCPGNVAALTYHYRYDDKTHMNARRWDVEYYCRGWQEHGHVHTTPSRVEGSGSGSQMTTEERRAVREHNKAWVVAERVRRDWLEHNLLRRNIPPKGTGAFLAAALLHDISTITHSLGYGGPGLKMANRMFGVESTGWGLDAQVVARADGVSDARGQVVALAVLAAAYEGRTSKDSWRRKEVDLARWLRFLQTCGYELSEIEEMACLGGEKRAAENAAAAAADADLEDEGDLSAAAVMDDENDAAPSD